MGKRVWPNAALVAPRSIDTTVDGADPTLLGSAVLVRRLDAIGAHGKRPSLRSAFHRHGQITLSTLANTADEPINGPLLRVPARPAYDISTWWREKKSSLPITRIKTRW